LGFVVVVPVRVWVVGVVGERAQEIDVQRAERAKQRAEQRVTRPQADMDFERARVALLKALTRLQVASRARTRV
jgi:F-type H+-transporting ATPase subunit epsilon